MLLLNVHQPFFPNKSVCPPTASKKPRPFPGYQELSPMSGHDDGWSYTTPGAFFFRGGVVSFFPEVCLYSFVLQMCFCLGLFVFLGFGCFLGGLVVVSC